jgi:hypothetical protein
VKLRIALTLSAVLVLTGCGSVSRMVDPYYGDFSCGAPEAGLTCKDLGTVYETLDNGITEKSAPERTYGEAPPPGEPPDFFKENEESLWLAYGAPFLKGALVGAGAGVLAGALVGESGNTKLETHNLPNGGKWYEEVRTDGNRLETALTGAAIAGGVGGVLAVLVSHYKKHSETLGRKEQSRLEEKASLYTACVNQARGKEKEEGTRAAVAAMHQCGSILADLPGLIPYRSAGLAEQLRAQRERDVKQMFTGLGDGTIPLRVPPRILRILVAPYVDSRDVLNRGHDLYIAVDEGRWILPRPGGDATTRILKPLEGKVE